MADEGKVESTGSRANDTAGSVFSRSAPAPTMPDWGTLKGSLGDLANDKSFEPIKDLPGLAKSFVDSQKMIGRGIFLPDEKAKPEDRKKSIDGIMKKLREGGIIESPPDSPDKYEMKFPAVDRFGNELQPNQPLIDSFKQAAHKAGIMPAVAQGLLDWYLNFQAEGEAQEDQQFQNMKSDLKKSWGGLYVRRMEASRRALAKYLGDDGDEVISSLPPAIGRRLVIAFSQIGEPMLEDALIEGSISGMPSADDIYKQIQTMMNDKTHPLNDVSKTGHKEAVAEYDRLNKMYVQLKKK